MSANFRTDMAMEQVNISENNNNGISTVYEKKHFGVMKTGIRIETDIASRSLLKPKGNYLTIDATGLPLGGMELKIYTAKLISECIGELFSPKLLENVLVVGLGNRNMTSDALGPKVVEKLIITRHIKDEYLRRLKRNMGSLAAINTGVLGITGIETFDIIRGVTEKIKPSCVIVADSLASKKTSRISTSFQLTDTGIVPGSGIANHRQGISESTLGVPVLAIGVPLVVYASTLTLDLLHSTYEQTPSLKPSDEDLSKLTGRLLSDTLGDLVVTPKDIDAIVETCAFIVALGINLAVHRGMSTKEILANM